MDFKSNLTRVDYCRDTWQISIGADREQLMWRVAVGQARARLDSGSSLGWARLTLIRIVGSRSNAQESKGERGGNLTAARLPKDEDAVALRWPCAGISPGQCYGEAQGLGKARWRSSRHGEEEAGHGASSRFPGLLLRVVGGDAHAGELGCGCSRRFSAG